MYQIFYLKIIQLERSLIDDIFANIKTETVSYTLYLAWLIVNKNKQNRQKFCEKDKTDIEFQFSVLMQFTAK